MTVDQLCKTAGFTPLVMQNPERRVNGAYCGDLLSWVMGRAQSDNIWITIMTNMNILAVAALSDVSCILLAEDTRPEQEVIETARQKGINILSSPKSAYELAVEIGKLI